MLGTLRSTGLHSTKSILDDNRDGDRLRPEKSRCNGVLYKSAKLQLGSANEASDPQ